MTMLGNFNPLLVAEFLSVGTVPSSPWVLLSMSDLYAAYEAWCQRRGDSPVKRKKVFPRAVRAAGMEVVWDGRAAYVRGTELLTGRLTVLPLPKGMDAADLPALSAVVREMARVRAVEGFTTVHDDAHQDGELEHAAAEYLCHAGTGPEGRAGFPAGKPGDLWPWDDAWWKPQNPVRDGVRGAALAVMALSKRLRRGEV